MLHTRVSTLEAFRRVVATEYGDEAALIRTIQGNPDPPSWQMEAGTAWHELLAGQESVEDRVSPYSFSLDDVSQARDCIGLGLWEVTAYEYFPIGPHMVEVKGTCDHINGLVIQDNKTKFSQSDARDYEASLQWRFYLLIHGAKSFRYNLWDFKDPNKHGYCELRGVQSFSFHRYVGMEQECQEWVKRFVDWAMDRNLISHLEDAQCTANL